MLDIEVDGGVGISTIEAAAQVPCDTTSMLILCTYSGTQNCNEVPGNQENVIMENRNWSCGQ